jgi:hypothetical protein
MDASGINMLGVDTLPHLKHGQNFGSTSYQKMYNGIATKWQRWKGLAGEYL